MVQLLMIDVLDISKINKLILHSIYLTVKPNFEYTELIQMYRLFINVIHLILIYLSAIMFTLIISETWKLHLIICLCKEQQQI